MDCLTQAELFSLSTGPRERSAEKLDRSKLGGDFRNYGGRLGVVMEMTLRIRGGGGLFESQSHSKADKVDRRFFLKIFTRSPPINNNNNKVFQSHRRYSREKLNQGMSEHNKAMSAAKTDEEKSIVVSGSKVILEVATKFPVNALVHRPKKNLHHDFIGTKTEVALTYNKAVSSGRLASSGGFVQSIFLESLRNRCEEIMNCSTELEINLRTLTLRRMQ